jgi:GTP-binding protein YchF
MRLAIVGAKGSGKSTLFRAFTGAAPGPGASADGSNVAVVKVRDERLEWLRDFHKPRKYTPVAVEVFDLPGMPDSSETTGMKLSELLAAARESEGLLVTVRAFEDPTYPYKNAAADTVNEASHVVAELAFADLDVATKRIDKLERKGGNALDLEKRELASLLKIRAALEEGKPVKSLGLSADDKKLLRGFRFLTDKPWVLVVALPDSGGEDLIAKIEGPFEARIGVRTKIEAEVAELDAADRASFMTDLGLESLASESVVRAAFTALGTIPFFTSGEDEVRAWPITRGSNAVEAAGKIHSDLARGFIRAEVYSFDDFKAAGGDVNAVKKAGRFRVEGKDYVVADGDILNIRFSV